MAGDLRIYLCLVLGLLLPRAHLEAEELWVEGRVLDAVGQAKPGVVVALEPLHCNGEEAAATSSRATTDRHGRYRFEAVEPGLWTVGVGGDGPSAGFERRIVPLLRDHRAAPLLWLDNAEDVVELRLLDQDDQPIPDARLDLRWQDFYGEAFWRARSDSSGRAPVPRSAVAHLQSVSVSNWTVARVDPEALEIVLEAGDPAAARRVSAVRSSLLLRTRTVTGRAIGKALVWSRVGPCFFWRVADDEGRVVLEASAPDEIYGAAVGFETTRIEHVRAAPDELHLDLVPALGSVAGRVVDRDGQGVEDVLVEWKSAGRAAVTNAAGDFAFYEVAEGRKVFVEARKEGFLPTSLRLDAASLEVAELEQRRTVTLERPWKAVGRVMIEEERAAESCRVSLSTAPEVSTACSHDGTFALTPLGLGPQALLVEAEGKSAWVEFSLAPASARPLELGDI